MNRVVGPVTGITTGVAAIVTIICWVLGVNGVAVPPEIQGAITTVGVLIAGWAVSPRLALRRAINEIHGTGNDYDPKRMING